MGVGKFSGSRGWDGLCWIMKFSRGRGSDNELFFGINTAFAIRPHLLK